MFSKSFLSVMIVTSAFTLVFGQTPDTKKDAEKAPKTFAFSFDGGGSYLGVQTQEVNKDNFAKFGLKNVRGVAIEKVMENSPAAAAGLQVGDVIIRFNGEDVTGARRLTRLVGEVDPDHQVRITVLRGGREQDVTATLEKRKMPAFENGTFEMAAPMGKMEFPDMKDMPDFKNLPQGEMKAFTVPGGEGKVFSFSTGGRQIGVGATPLTKQLAAHFGVDGGVLVSEVRDGSPAEKAGLKAGDIIVEADGKALKGNFDLIKAVNDKKDGPVNLTIVRDGSRQTISVTPEASKDGGNFFYKGDGEDGSSIPAIPAMPGNFKVVPPVPAVPASAPVPPMVWAQPGRVI